MQRKRWSWLVACVLAIGCGGSAPSLTPDALPPELGFDAGLPGADASVADADSQSDGSPPSPADECPDVTVGDDWRPAASALIAAYFAQGADRAAVTKQLIALGQIPRADIPLLVKQAYVEASRGPRLSGATATFDWKGERLTSYISLPARVTPWKDEPGGVPLVIGLHGGAPGVTGFATNAQKGWGKAATDRGAIAIFPNMPVSNRDHWQTAGGTAYVRMIVEAAKRTWQIDSDRIYYVGHSYGGFGSFYMGTLEPDTLAGIAALAFDPSPLLPRENLRNVAFYGQWGSQDPWVKKSNMVADWATLTQALGALNQQYAGYLRRIDRLDWDHRYPPNGTGYIFDWLFATVRDPFPQKIVNRRLLLVDAQRSYWIEGQAIKSTVVATRSGNAFEIASDAKNEALRILLAGEMVDFSRKIELTVNGKALPAVCATPNLSTLVRTMAKTQDLRMVFVAELPAPSN